MNLTGALCVGNWDLFDATDLISHRAAAETCARCPVIDACRKQLAEAREHAHAGVGPSGTWAGQLVGRPRQKVAECGTDGGYSRHLRLGEPTCDACRAARREVSRRNKAKQKAAAA